MPCQKCAAVAKFRPSPSVGATQTEEPTCASARGRAFSTFLSELCEKNTTNGFLDTSEVLSVMEHENKR
jgi:hypothetical protein